MIKVLCNRELQQWCFADKLDSEETDLVFMSGFTSHYFSIPCITVVKTQRYLEFIVVET